MTSFDQLNSSQRRTELVDLVARAPDRQTQDLIQGPDRNNTEGVITLTEARELGSGNDWKAIRTIHAPEAFNDFLLGKDLSDTRGYTDFDVVGLNFALMNALNVDEVFSCFIEYLDELMNDSENLTEDDDMSSPILQVTEIYKCSFFIQLNQRRCSFNR